MVNNRAKIMVNEFSGMKVTESCLEFGKLHKRLAIGLF
jgi:hypothetical protein